MRGISGESVGTRLVDICKTPEWTVVLCTVRTDQRGENQVESQSAEVLDELRAAKIKIKIQIVRTENDIRKKK
jgi:hypothetical protein